MTVSLDDIVVRNTSILAARAGAEVLAMNEQSGTCFSLAGSGAHIWEATAQPISVRDICSALRERYTIDESDCARETIAYITMLVDEDLLHAAPAEVR